LPRSRLERVQAGKIVKIWFYSWWDAREECLKRFRGVPFGSGRAWTGSVLAHGIEMHLLSS
jgi:hypothetical protein